jgi:hypothetical protein
MSDITPVQPEKEDQTNIPHSGNLGLESPTNEFDKTTLQEAHESGLINPVPNTVPQELITPAADKKRPTWVRKTVAATALFAAGVGATLGITGHGHSSSNNEPLRTKPGVEKIDDKTSKVSSENDAKSDANAKEPQTGSSVETEQAADTIEVERASGEIIKVKRLPDLPDDFAETGEGVDEYMKGFNELMAAYFTTGNEAVLSEITPVEAQKQELRRSRNVLFVDAYINYYNAPELEPYFQIVIDDLPSQTTSYATTYQGGYPTIKANSDLLWQFSDDHKYGSYVNMSTAWKPERLSGLNISLNKVGEKYRVIGIGYQVSP